MPTVLHPEGGPLPTEWTKIDSNPVEPSRQHQTYPHTGGRPLNLATKLQENGLQPASKMAVFSSDIRKMPTNTEDKLSWDKPRVKQTKVTVNKEIKVRRPRQCQYRSDCSSCQQTHLLIRQWLLLNYQSVFIEIVDS